MPELDLSEELRARLIWLAMETKQDVETALTTLLDFFLEWRDADSRIETLAAILRLGQQLQLAEINIETLHGYLETLTQLRAHGCGYDDVPEAQRLIVVLEALPFAWTWKQADIAVRAMAAILEAGLTLKHVQGFVAAHHRLEELGFDEALAVAVAEAVTRAGVSGDRRAAVLHTLANGAGHQVDLEALATRRQELDAVIADLEGQQQEAADRLQGLQAESELLEQHVSQLNETKKSLDEECQSQLGALALARALRKFLLGKSADAEALWRHLDAILMWRRKGGRVDDVVGSMYAREIRNAILTFIEGLVRDTAKEQG